MVYSQVKYNLQVLASYEAVSLRKAQVYRKMRIVLLRKLTASVGGQSIDCVLWQASSGPIKESFQTSFNLKKNLISWQNLWVVWPIHEIVDVFLGGILWFG